MRAGYSIVEQGDGVSLLQRARRHSDRAAYSYQLRSGLVVANLHRDQVRSAARLAERFGAELGPLGDDLVARIVMEVRAWDERRAAAARAVAQRVELADIERRVEIHRARAGVSGSRR